MTVDNIRGIWFYGLAGSGKTFASSICKEIYPNAFIIDGDDVREYLSYDLRFSASDRKIQVNRMLGISKLVLKNCMFPIVSSVTMHADLLKECEDLSIMVVLLTRPFEQLQKARSIYKDNVNVVGKDIPLGKFNTIELQNYGNSDFIRELRQLFG